MSEAQRLVRGGLVRFDGQVRQIVALTGTLVQLRWVDEWTGIRAPDLMASPGFAILDEIAAEQAQSRYSPLDLGAALEAEPDDGHGARWKLAHLNEARFGYRSGHPDRPQQGEPRAAYDRELVRSLKARMQAKAEELGVGLSTLYRWRRQYYTEGLEGLVDRNELRERGSFGHADPRLLDAIVLQHKVVEAQDSSGNLARFRRRLQDRLDHEHGAGAVAIPSDKTLAKYIEALLPGEHTMGPATTRRTEAARPKRPFHPNPAVRPGQVVMIDATPLNVIAYDPVGDVTHGVKLVAAIDVATRTLLAWRMTAGETKAVDTVLLLNDAITPEPMRPGWKKRLAYEMARLPVPRKLDYTERLELAAARPVIWPEEILVDHAKVNLSDAMYEACGSLKIELGLARKGHPTDKAHIEQVFRTIDEQFCKHVAGYKGPNVSRRGRLVEDAARWALEDLEEFFAEYVVAIYQQRVHSGLVVPGFPNLEMSPNEAYSQAVARFGFVACPPKSHHYCDKLPIIYRVIRPEGIQHNYLIYDDPVLRTYRKALSPTPGKDRAWPVRHHPNDPSRVFIKLAGTWHAIPWTHLPETAEPFTGRMVEQARALLVHAGNREPTQQEIADTLVDLQRRMDAPESSTARTRRELTRARQDARTARRDQHRAGIGEADTPPPQLHLVPTEDADGSDEDELSLEELGTLPTWEPGQW